MKSCGMPTHSVDISDTIRSFVAGGFRSGHCLYKQSLRGDCTKFITNENNVAGWVRWEGTSHVCRACPISQTFRLISNDFFLNLKFHRRSVNSDYDCEFCMHCGSQ